MSPVKQIVKASITSLWQSRAEVVPTAGISRTLSPEWDLPSPPQGASLAPRRRGSPVGSCEAPSGKTDWFLSAPCYLPSALPSVCKPAPQGAQGWRKPPPKSHRITEW